MAERLEWESEDWLEREKRRKQQVVEEIARELRDKHPELFGRKLFGASMAGVQKLVEQAVVARADVLPEDREDIVWKVASQASGYGPLARFFAPEAAEITEVLVNPTVDGPEVWYGERGRHRCAGREYFESNKHLMDWVTKVCEDAGQPLTVDNPCVDAWLADGSRLSVVAYAASPLGPMLTIRKSPQSRPPMPLEKLVENAMMPRFIADFLADVVVKGHANLGVFGRTDSGKTTLLRALGLYIEPDERTLIAETSFELWLPSVRNSVNLVEVIYRDRAVVSMETLCRVLNRSNPDRAIVGEIRGREIVAAARIGASTSGGFWTTGHAGDVNSLRAALKGMYREAGERLAREDLDEEISSMFHFLVFVDKEKFTPEQRRTLMSVVEVLPGGGYRTVFRFDAARFVETGGRERRWVYEAPPTEERLALLAFRGANVRPEHTRVEAKYLYAEGGAAG